MNWLSGVKLSGPLYSFLSPVLLQDGYPMDGRLHEHAEVVPVLLEQLELEGVGQRVGCDPRLRRRLEPADDEATDLLLDVGVPVGVAQDREVRMDALDGLGHHVEVLGRVEGHVDPAQEADSLRPLAGAVDDDLGLDGAPVRDDTRHPAVRVVTPVTRVCSAMRTPRMAGAPGEGGRHVDRVDGGVTGQPEGAEQVARLEDGIALERLGRGEQLALEVVGLRRGRRPAELDHPLGRAGHRDAAAPLEAGGQARLRLELAVEAGGVLHEAGARLRRPELAEQARRMPRRAARELSLFEEEDVGPPEAGQVVGGRGPDDTAPDDDDTRPVGQVALRRRTLHVRPSLAASVSVCPRHVGQEALEVGAGEGGLGPLVLLHPPAPEVEVDRAGRVLDGRPQRPAVLGHEAPQAGAGQVAPGGRAVVVRRPAPPAGRA